MTVEEPLQPVKNDANSLSIRDLFYKYLRFLPLFVLCLALSLLGAYIYLRYATLVYQASGTLVIQNDNKSAAGNDKIEQLMVSDGNKNIQNEIEYLQSRPLMERVVKELNLNFSYLVLGNIKELNVYKSAPFEIEAFEIADSTHSFTYDIEFINSNSFRLNKEEPTLSFGQVFKNKNGVFRLVRKGDISTANAYQVTWRPTSAAASELLNDLVVAPKQGTGILTINKQATNPYLAADVVNQLMVEYQEAVIEDKNISTRNTLTFIDTRLAVVDRELDSINRRLLQFQEANNLIDPATQSSNFLAQIQEAAEASSEQTIQLNNAEMLTDYLQDRGMANDPVPSSLGISDPTLNNMVMAYNQAQLERKSLLENAPPGNVAVKQKGEQVEQLLRKILENLRNLKTAYRSSIQSVQGKGGLAQSKVQNLPAKMQVVADMTRAQQSKLVILNSLLQKKEESSIALASQISNTKILQEAVANNTPIKPNRRNTQLLAIVIGLVVPALFIFVIELLNDKVNSRQDIERYTHATILGEVGHFYGKENLIVTSNSRKVVAEQFRMLRSNLQYVLNHVEKPVVLVTSSFSGEGKSFVSSNIGAVMALAGKKTIVLEFDIRKPKVLSHLGLPKHPGFTNYLLGKVQLQDLPIPVPGHDNLYVLAAGPIPPNPSELLLDPKLNELFDYLKANFDVVVMDTAPVGMVSDALTLSKFADCTLYIMRQGHTFKRQVALVDDYYQAGKLPKISIVLNDVKVQAGYGSYGYGGGRYGYGYGSGYFEDEEEQAQGWWGRVFRRKKG
jgi:capsular exopolysaccharide synthesis family protein